MAHDDFVAGAAHAHDVDAFGAGRLGLGHQVRVGGRGQDHLREYRFVPMSHDVDVVFLEYAEVGLGAHRFRCAEEHVRNLCGHHGAPPSVGNGGLEALQDQVDRVIVHTDVGAVHDLNYLTVDAPRVDAHLLPLSHPFFRSPAGELEKPLLFAELAVDRLGQVQGHLFLAATVGGNAVFPGQGRQLGFIFDLVSAALALGRQQQRVGQIPAVVGMGGRPPCDHADQVTGHDDIGGGAADASLGSLILEGADPAGAHVAVAATDSQFPKPALGKHFLIALPDRLETELLCAGEHLVDRGINASFQNLVTVSHDVYLLCWCANRAGQLPLHFCM